MTSAAWSAISHVLFTKCNFRVLLELLKLIEVFVLIKDYNCRHELVRANPGTNAFQS